MPIKRRKNNDDFMSREMDERLQELEASISTIYAGATEEATARLDAYLLQFEESDRREYARMLEGEITEEDYIAWRKRAILYQQYYEATVNDLTDMLVNADIAAIALVNDDLPYVIAESYNFTQYVGHLIADRERNANVSFQIYNAQSVQALIRDNPDLLPAVNIPEDQRWNRTHINRELTQAIIGGDSIPRIAERLARVTHMDNNSAVRAARTSMTAAENLGRNESYNRIRSQGIGMVKRWSATYDARTRATHRLLDNTTANKDGKFGEGILDALGEPLMEYPADPAGAAAERYNCRCRLNVVPPNYSRDVTVREYEQWLRNNYPEDYAALADSKYFDRLRPTNEWHEQAQQEFTRRLERLRSQQTAYQYRGHVSDDIEYRRRGRFTTAGRAAMAEELGITTREAQSIQRSIEKYSSSDYDLIRIASRGDSNAEPWAVEASNNIERFIELSPRWNGGQISRGLFVNSEDDLNVILSAARTGQTIDMRGISSWTSNTAVSDKYARTFIADFSPEEQALPYNRGTSVVFITNETSTPLGTSIRHLSGMRSEDEIIVSGQAVFEPTQVTECNGIYYIYGDIRRKR